MDLDRHKEPIMAAIRDGHAVVSKWKAPGWTEQPLNEEAAWGDVAAGLRRFAEDEVTFAEASAGRPTTADMRKGRDRLKRISARARGIREQAAQLLDDPAALNAILTTALAQPDLDAGAEPDDIVDEFRGQLRSLGELATWLAGAANQMRPQEGSPLARLMWAVSPAYTQHTGATKGRSRAPSDGREARPAGGPYVRFVCACAEAAGMAYQPEAVVSTLKRLKSEPEWDRVSWRPTGAAMFQDYLDALPDMGRE